MEKLFSVAFRLYNGINYYAAIGFVFAANVEEAKEKAKECMRESLKLDTDRPSWVIQRVVQIDDQLIIKAYNNLPSTNNN